MRPVRTSLKIRIVLFMGSMIILLMMIISISVLYRWRALILETQRQNALSVTRTFAASILDGLIFMESGLLPNEGYLENQVHSFLGKNPEVKWITIFDSHGQIMARSSFAGAGMAEQAPAAGTGSFSSQAAMQIAYSAGPGWILEISHPLQIHSKNWGSLRMGFDFNATHQRLKRLFIFILGLTIVFATGLLAIIWLFIGRLTRSLRQLVAEMDRFDLEKITPTQMHTGEDEIGMLVNNFEKMKQRLHQSRNQLLDAQRQVYQAEKLASIGRLASGVAHEINNPLHGLKSCLYAIEREPQNLPQLRSYLKLADEGLDHIALIVQKLLGFSRQHAKQTIAMDLNNETEKVLSLLAFRLDKNQIIIERDFARPLPELHADPYLIQEVILNLLLNSMDSMEEGGTIRITTRCDGAVAVRLEIADTGCGIDAKDMDRIFDPFFTTKEEGKGTGLGLSVSLGIIESHGGTITCESRPYRGTTFFITLPLHGSL
ncbi:MAG TPA: ATP-binding protein [bacterium]|nr:ATP-binding protein [bacterium]HPR87648.1 ATP-binding protein [bacterium]